LPAVPERILEAIKAHLFESLQREHGGLEHHETTLEKPKRDTVLLVRVPYFPTSARFTQQLEALTVARPKRAAWAIVSDGGGAYLSFPESKAVSIPDDHTMEAARMTAEAVRTMRNPWSSDVASALMTILLMRRAQPRSQWSDWTPSAAVQDIEALAIYLGVGRSTLYGVILEFERDGWMSSERGRLPTLTDIPGLVNWFFDHRKHVRDQRLAVVPLYAPAWKIHDDILHWLRTTAGTSSITWAITGWQACALHDLGVLVNSDVKPMEIVVREPVSAVLREWQLKSQPYTGGPSLHVIATPMPITTFACTGIPIKGLPVVDPWQAALHVISDPNRGIEQATAIVDSLWLGQL
jgi:hypothetical protein